MSAIDMCNKSILRALLIPSLIFGNGDGSGSYSLGQEHSKTFLQILDGMLSGLQEVLKEQLIKEMLAYNFPEEMWKKDGLGEFSTRDFSQEEQDKIMTTYEKAITAGVIDVNDLADLNKMRNVLGFPDRDQVIEKENPMDMFADEPEKDNFNGNN
jgi:phage gp29-like protein